MKKIILFSAFLFACVSNIPAAEETMQSKQIANCERIGYPEWRDDCFESLGPAVLNYGVCLKITNKDRRSLCIEAHPALSSSDCLMNQADPKERNNCLASLAKQQQDGKICEMIDSKTAKTACLSSLGIVAVPQKIAAVKVQAKTVQPKVKKAAPSQNSDKAEKLQRAKEEKEAQALARSVKLQNAQDARAAKANEEAAKRQAAKDALAAKAQEKAAKIQAEKDAQAQMKAEKIQKAKEEKDNKAAQAAAKVQAEKDAREAKAQERAAKIQAEKDKQAQLKAEKLQKVREQQEEKERAKAERSQTIKKEEPASTVIVPAVEQKVEEVAPPAAEEVTTPATVETAPAVIEEKTSEVEQPILEDKIETVSAPAAEEKPAEVQQAIENTAPVIEQKIEEPPQKTKAQLNAEKIQKAKEEREALAKEKAAKLAAAKEAAAQEKAAKLQKAKEAKEAAEKEKAEKLQKAKDDKEAAAKEKAEKIQKAKEEREAAKKSQVKAVPAEKSPVSSNETMSSNSKGPTLALVGFGCTKGFGSWTEPPQKKNDEIACDKENVQQFDALLNHCMAADHDINILSYDMNKDLCVTCDDLKLWQKQAKKLFETKKRSTDGRALYLKECAERKF